MSEDEGPSNVVDIGEGRRTKKGDTALAPTTDLSDRIAAYQLDVDKNGAPTGTLANLMKVLSLDERWSGTLRLNSRALVLMVGKSPIHDEDKLRPVKDADIVRIAVWFGTEYGIKTSKERVGQIVSTVADGCAFDSVRVVLDDLVWDGEARLDAWLTECIGAEDSPYVRAVGSRWLISAVARTYDPGCQADCTLVLEGPQGIGKSSALRSLVLKKDWLAEHVPDLGNKDAMLTLSGPIVVEFSELAALYRSNAVAIKSFLTRRVDRLRVPYGTITLDYPRRCVFAATTNENEYLRDETGNRRFWPVECGWIDLTRLEREREQLWAEAVHRYKAGEPWYITDKGIEAEAFRRQRERQQDDPWLDIVSDYVDRQLEKVGRDKVRVRTDDLFEALGVERARWSQSARRRLADCLRQLGLQSKTVRDGSKTLRAYVFPPGDGGQLSM